jgi:hypothetical protein
MWRLVPSVRILDLLRNRLAPDYQDALSDVRVPSAGLVWWKAEIRARQDAVQTVNRPIRWAQYIAAGCGIAAVLFFLRLVDFSVFSGFHLQELIGISCLFPSFTSCWERWRW